MSSTWLCSDAGAVVWACKCAADIGALMLVRARECALPRVSDAGAVVWACKCAADIGALMLV